VINPRIKQESLFKQEDEKRHFVVSTNVKFPVERKTRKRAYYEYQTHGYEIDLVAARRDCLVLAGVKSFFGSRGVSRQCFRGLADERRRTSYERVKGFDDPELRNDVTAKACELYEYKPHQVEWRPPT
jgi:hypothetical protein